MKTRFLLLAFLPVCGFASAPAPREPEKAAPTERMSWLIDLLPTAFQKNPRVQTTVITEMSEAGKKRPPPSPDRPVYFILGTNGAKELGDKVAGEKPAKQEVIERALVRALASAHYLPATLPEHPPGLLIVYTWGVHNLVEDGSANMAARNLIDRAALVGGDKFAANLARSLQQSENFALTTRERVPEGFIENYTPEMRAFMDPLNIFRMENRTNESLLDQASSEIYFVMAFAYDFAGVREKRRVPLWRTRMTVPSQGVTQESALPALVLAAGPYFGKDMDGPVITPRRLVREGNVEIGTPTVVPSNGK